MDSQASVDFAKKYLEDILSFFGLNTEVVAHVDEDVIELSVPSTYLNGFLIGQHGETLRSIQFLIGTTLKNRGAELNRVNLDIADYKQQRNERLAKQAEEWIRTAREKKEPLHLVPMSAAERRVVHKVVGDYGDLTTESQGEGKDRHIVITPNEL